MMPTNASSPPASGTPQWPMPWTTGAIALMWLMLSGWSVASVLMAALLGWGGPRLLGVLGVPQVPGGMGRPVRMLGLAVVVTWDILKSAWAVTCTILFRPQAARPAFVWVPVATDHPAVLATLACIITMTPGTMSVRILQGPDRTGLEGDGGDCRADAGAPVDVTDPSAVPAGGAPGQFAPDGTAMAMPPDWAAPPAWSGQTPACILVHAVDCDDPDAVVTDIRHRYERPLLEIFGCRTTH